MNRRKRRRNHKQPDWYSAYGGRRRLVEALVENKNSSSEKAENGNIKELSPDCSEEHSVMRDECRTIGNINVNEAENAVYSDTTVQKVAKVKISRVADNLDDQNSRKFYATGFEQRAFQGNQTTTTCQDIEAHLNDKHLILNNETSEEVQNLNENSVEINVLEENTNTEVQNEDPADNSIDVPNTNDTSSEENGIITRTVTVTGVEEVLINIPMMKKRLSLTTSLPNFVSIISTTGSVKLTAANYEFLRSLLKTTTEDFSMFTYRTVHDVIWPHLKTFCLPTSDLVDLVENFCIVKEGTSYNRNRVARVVLPSTWAKVDVSTYQCYKELISIPDSKNGPSIDNSNIYVQRDLMSSIGKVVPVLYKHGIFMACSTDDIYLPVGRIKSSVSIEQWKRSREERFLNGISLNESNETIEGSLGPIWMVKQNISGSDECDRIISCQLVQSVLQSEREIIHFISNQFSMRKDKNIKLRYQNNDEEAPTGLNIASPGDICAFLRPLDNDYFKDKNSLTCLLIARHKSLESHALDREIIVWISITMRKIIKICASCAVSGFPMLLNAKTKRKSFRRTRRLPRYGTLSTGKRFVRYPILLYHDDFNPSSTLYPHGSVGGCYFLPLGLSQKTRESPTSARIITLTPSGCSTVLALKYIVNDLVEGATIGIPGKDPYGKDIQIFVDTVGFVADYPACSPVLDVKSHTADAPCHCCSFRRRKHETGSNYSYSVMINSRRLGFVRSAERSETIRRYGLSDVEAKHLGMKEGGEERLERSPFFEFHTKLKNCNRDIILSSDREPIVSSSFDPYNAVMVAPDHALMGICRSAIELYFHCLPDNSTRLHMNILICQNMSDNGLPRQQSVYNHATKKVQSMTMTSVFCVLLVLAPICDIFLGQSEVNMKVNLIVRKIQDIVSIIYWWPRKDLDGELFNSENMSGEVSRRLIFMIDSFTKEIHSLCVLDNELGRIIDKPNIHRLVELGFQSIPNFGHARLFSEMPLETVHQVLKSAMKGNTHPDKHISAMFHAICADWQRRVLSSANQLFQTEDKNEKYSILKSICFLLLGHEAWYLDVENLDHKDLFKNLMNNLRCIFKEPFKTNVFKMSSVNTSHLNKKRKWNWRGIGKSSEESHIINGKRILKQSIHEIQLRDIFECSYATFSDNEKTTSGGKNYPYHRINYGTVIQVSILKELQESTKFISNIPEFFNAERKPSLFVVCGILRARSRPEVWCIVMKISETCESNNIYHSVLDGESCIGVIQLTETVRRAGYVHRCNSDCKLDPKSRIVHHSSSIFEKENSFAALRRTDGYPPRMA